MFNPGGYKFSFAINQMQELSDALQKGFKNHPVTSDENKKSLLESMKELDELAKEFFVEEQVDARLIAQLTADAAAAKENKIIDKLMEPIESSYPSM